DQRERRDRLCGFSRQLSNLSLRASADHLPWSVFRRVPGLEDVAIASGRRAERRRPMIKHLIKLVWNRKRFNFLITVEFFFSFLTLFCVILAGVYFADNYRHPLGFNYENVWNVGIDMKQASDDYHSPEQVETTRQLYLSLREFDEVEMAAGVHVSVFGTGGIGNATEINGKRVFYNANEVTD